MLTLLVIFNDHIHNFNISLGSTAPNIAFPNADNSYMQQFKPSGENMMAHQEYMKMMGMNPFMYMMPVMKNMMPNWPDFRYNMGNYAFYPMPPNARPSPYAPYMMYGDQDNSATSINSIAGQESLKERFLKSRSDSPKRNCNNK